MMIKKSVVFFVTTVLLCLNISAGWIEVGDEGQTIINLKLHSLPDSSRTDTPTLASIAVVESFKKNFSKTFNEDKK